MTGLSQTQAGMHVCGIYRQEQGVFCCSGILFSHELSYRSPQFVTRKIVSGAVDIYLGLQDESTVGSSVLSSDEWWCAARYRIPG